MDWQEIIRLARKHAVEMAVAGKRALAEAVEAQMLAEDAIKARRLGKELQARELGAAAERAWFTLQRRVGTPATERYTEIERALAHSSTEGILAEDLARRNMAADILRQTAVKRGASASPPTDKAAWYRRAFPR